MIAFSIIAICGGALLINFQKSHRDRQEKDAVDIVQSKLRMASKLAKITGGEIKVIFGEQDGVTTISTSSDIDISARMKAALSRITPLPLIKDVAITPDSGKISALSFYPWGLDDRDVEITLYFASGEQVTCHPAKQVPNVIVEDANEVYELFPSELLEDEKEETHVYTN